MSFLFVVTCTECDVPTSFKTVLTQAYTELSNEHSVSSEKCILHFRTQAQSENLSLFKLISDKKAFLKRDDIFVVHHKSDKIVGDVKKLLLSCCENR